MVTLDNIHQSTITSLKTQDLDKQNKILSDLEDVKKKYLKDPTSRYSNDLMELNEKIEKVKKRIKEGTGNICLKNYYMDTGDILFKYYEGIENVETTKTTATVSEGGILSYLGCNEVDVSEESIQSSEFIQDELILGEPISREELRHRYLNKLNINLGVKSKKVTTKLKTSSGVCEACGAVLSHIPTEGVVECTSCGMVKSILNDTDKSSYKDPPKESCYYSYRRSNHFNEWIAQFQGKETTQIPRHVLLQVISEIKKERIRNLNSLTSAKVRSILKKLKLNKFYEHVPHIINQLNGKPPPYMSRQTEEVLRIMFQKIQGPFLEFCPKTRKNFLSYSYVLHKFVELLGFDHLKPLFPLLKSIEKLKSQDIIWKQICNKLNWEYTPSV